MKRYIADGLKDFLQEGNKPWHMPGHKRKLYPSDSLNTIDNALCSVIDMDVTEVPGTDDLYEPEEMIKSSLEELKALYDTVGSYYLVNGATVGILAAIAAVNEYCRLNNDGRAANVLMAANCHKSVFNATRLMGCSCGYIEPEKEGEIYKDITPATIAKHLSRMQYDVVIITSPTYEGVVSDIEGIKKELDKYGTLLIVDEAHGAHLPFVNICDYPRSAVSQKADIVVQSLHKTLPAMTQTAIMHVNNEKLDLLAKKQLEVFMTSSPSYPMLCSMEAAITWAGSYDYSDYIKRLKEFRKRAGNLSNFSIVDSDALKNVFAYDITRIVIRSKKSAVSGKRIARALYEEEKIVVEMSGVDYVVLISTPADTSADFDILYKALEKLDNRILEFQDNCDVEDEIIKQIRALIGKNAEKDLYVYPPGSYVARKDEYVSEKIADELIKYHRAGLNIRGLR